MKADLGFGFIVGILSFYGLSLSSALWLARPDPNDTLWAILISSGVAILLGSLIAWRPRISITLSSVMILLILVGIMVGSDTYDWVAPLPGDLTSLFLHGARSPFVIIPATMIGASGIARFISGRTRSVRSDSQAAPHA